MTARKTKENSLPYGFNIPAEWLQGNPDHLDLSQTSKYDTSSQRRRVERTSHITGSNASTATEDPTPQNNRRRNRLVDPGTPITAYVQQEPLADAQKALSRQPSKSDTTEFHALTKRQLSRLLPFNPVEKLGQNFLINDGIARKFVNYTIPGASVVEVGVGPGNMTRGIARIAHDVTGLEIFPGYGDCHEKYLSHLDNVKVIIGDALKFDFKRWAEKNRGNPLQVMGNIPFHISEGLLTRLVALGNQLESVTLLVGENLRETISASDNPYHERFTKLAFVLSVYDKSHITVVQKDDFWPAPPVEGGMVNLTPRECSPDGKDTALIIRKKILKHSDLEVAKIIRDESNRIRSSKTLDHVDSNRYDRRQTRRSFNRMTRRGELFFSEEESQTSTLKNNLFSRINLPADILNTPFERLNSQQVRQLAIALDNL